MKVTAVQNVTIEQGKEMIEVITPEKKGLVISSFDVEFVNSFDEYEIDKCDCIALSVLTEQKKMMLTAITQKQGINEIITISTVLNNVRKHNRIKFVRK